VQLHRPSRPDQPRGRPASAAPRQLRTEGVSRGGDRAGDGRGRLCAVGAGGCAPAAVRLHPCRPDPPDDHQCGTAAFAAAVRTGAGPQHVGPARPDRRRVHLFRRNHAGRVRGTGPAAAAGLGGRPGAAAKFGDRSGHAGARTGSRAQRADLGQCRNDRPGGRRRSAVGPGHRAGGRSLPRGPADALRRGPAAAGPDAVADSGRGDAGCDHRVPPQLAQGSGLGDAVRRCRHRARAVAGGGARCLGDRARRRPRRVRPLPRHLRGRHPGDRPGVRTRDQHRPVDDRRAAGGAADPGQSGDAAAAEPHGRPAAGGNHLRHHRRRHPVRRCGRAARHAADDRGAGAGPPRIPGRGQARGAGERRCSARSSAPADRAGKRSRRPL
ncbi:MAG: hypothetical protein AVDCRST_MAG31-930, partial [uncultured Sphingomonas sp.]